MGDSSPFSLIHAADFRAFTDEFICYQTNKNALLAIDASTLMHQFLTQQTKCQTPVGTRMWKPQILSAAVYLAANLLKKRRHHLLQNDASSTNRSIAKMSNISD